MDWLVSLLKEFKDFIFRPFTLLAFGFISLTLLILPESYSARIGVDNLVKQHRTALPVATIIFLVAGFIRFCDVYISPRVGQKVELKKRRKSFQRELDTLSIYELSILAYCLSRNRITFFILDQGRKAFENAVRSLTTRGFFKQGPLAIQGYSFDITDDYWQLLRHFKEDIRKRAEAAYPDLERKFEFYDEYQRAYGFGQVEPAVQKKEIAPTSESQPADLQYTLYTRDVLHGIIWKWRYNPEFGEMPLNLTPYCPDCEQQLIEEHPWGGNVFMDQHDGGRYKYLTCSVHRKDYEIPVDRQGDYVMVIANILNNIETGRWKEIVDRQRK